MNKVLIYLANILSILIKMAVYIVSFYLGVAGFIALFTLFGLIPSLLLLPAILFVLPFIVLVEVMIFRILIPKPRIGVHKIGSWTHFLYQLNNRVFDITVNPLFPPFAALYKNSELFRIFTLKVCGANVKFSSKIGRTTRIHDPYLFTAGTRATVGEEVQIFSFALEIGKIILHRVFIGPKAHVSAASLIFPGTEIGEGSVLGMGSSTRNDMKIPQYELWVGNPASHLSKLTRPLLYTASHGKEHKEPRDFRDKDRRFGGKGGYGRDRGRDRGDRGDRGGRDRGRDRDRGGRDRGRDRDRGGRGRFERKDSRFGGGRPSRGPRDSRGPRREERPAKPSFNKEEGGQSPYIGPIDVNQPKPVEPQQEEKNQPINPPQAPVIEPQKEAPEPEKKEQSQDSQSEQTSQE